MRIFINAGNVVAAGPQIVLRNLLPALLKAYPDSSFMALLPEQAEDVDWAKFPNLTVSFAPKQVPPYLRRLFEMFVLVPRLCKRFKADACLTLGNIGPIQLPVPHVVLLHHSYILDGSIEAVRRLPAGARLTNAYTRWHFSKMVRRCFRVIVQSPIMADGVEKTFGVGREKITVIPSTLSDRLRRSFAQDPSPDVQMTKTGESVRLLFLASFYWHKNHAVLPALLSDLNRRQMLGRIHLFLTIDDSSSAARKLLRELSAFPETVTNLGPVSEDRVPALLRGADALLLPTLMESFGLVYLEAMAAKTPILTSDRPFARWICEATARYFDPHDPHAISDVISDFVLDGPEANYAPKAIQRLHSFPGSWDEIGRLYMNTLQAAAT